MEMAVEAEVNKLINEYLSLKGYSRTLSTFKSECEQGSREGISSPSNTSSTQAELLTAFECGEKEAFCQLWEEHVPANLRSRNPTCQHLECSVNVYFAVYPIRTGTGDKERAMGAFRGFLESRAADLANNKELATYFALPYVPDLSKHPTFKNLFLDSWTVELKARLVQFLKSTLPSPTDEPLLVNLYLDSKKSGGVVVQEDCVRKLAEVQSSYHALVGIAMELVGALESAVAGNMITPEYIQQICSRLLLQGSGPVPSSTHYSPPPPPQIDMPRPSTSTSVLRASILSLRQSVQMSEENFPELDFAKIKSDLVSQDETRRALIIQALRWRLTRSLPGNQRTSVLSSFIDNDLLGCSQRQDASYQSSIIDMMQAPHPLLKEQLARLFNSISSLASGRSYLSQAPPIVKALLQLMYWEREDSDARKNALGAVQKLSLRRSLARMMIKDNIVQWVVDNLLTQQDTLSDYTLRYSLALLMNISLRSIGKFYCSSYGETLLRVLSEMLEHEDLEIRSYVNGTLYSLLSSPTLREEARKMGMEEMLHSALKSSPAELQDQIKYIIVQFQSTDISDSSEDSGDEEGEIEEEEEDDPDLIEGDEAEILTATDAHAVGETLLIREYLLGDNGAHIPLVSSTTNAHTGDEVMMMSSTPKHHQPVPRVEDSNNSQLTAELNSGISVQNLPYARPVTPQSFSRPHTASKALPQQSLSSALQSQRPNSVNS